MSLPDVRVGRCGLCGWPCDGDLCSAHADCGNPVDDAAIDLHIGEMLSPPSESATAGVGFAS